MHCLHSFLHLILENKVHDEIKRQSKKQIHQRAVKPKLFTRCFIEVGLVQKRFYKKNEIQYGREKEAYL
jgi:hypothetical protein